jgi:glycosyltransferase involved in cell wall biosynthesis
MKISVITATYNAAKCLPDLVDSLVSQTDRDFEWVVSDGKSTDSTLEIISGVSDLNVTISSQKDFGIYDALNHAIEISSGDFYIVVGADDILYPNAIADYKSALDPGSADIVTAGIIVAGKIHYPSKKSSWIYGMSTAVSGHAVGCCIRKSLHDRLGLYSRRFPICADQLFVGNVLQVRSKVKVISSVVGVYGDQGISSTDVPGMLSEFFRVQIELGYNRYLQTFLFIVRLVKNIRKFGNDTGSVR